MGAREGCGGGSECPDAGVLVGGAPDRTEPKGRRPAEGRGSAVGFQDGQGEQDAVAVDVQLGHSA